jgi:hypothetical protein
MQLTSDRFLNFEALLAIEIAAALTAQLLPWPKAALST